MGELSKDPDVDLSGDSDLDEVMKDLDKSPDKLDDMPVQSDSRWRKVKHILKEGAIGSSCHGLPHIGEAHTTRVILFWTVILLCCLTGFIYLFYTTLDKYMQHGKTVNMMMGVDEIDFPAVTICNINPYKQSAIQDVEGLQALSYLYDQATKGSQGSLGKSASAPAAAAPAPAGPAAAANGDAAPAAKAPAAPAPAAPAPAAPAAKAP